MAFKDWLNQKLDSATLVERINATDSRSHSRFYHRFFAGYTEARQLKADGRGYTISRVYTGRYYRRKLTKTGTAVYKTLYALLFLAAAAAFCFGALSRVEANAAWYAALAEALSVVPVAWWGVSAFNYVLSPEKMTVYEYKSSSVSLKRSSAAAAITLTLAALAFAAHILVYAQTDDGRSVLCAAGFLGGALCAFTANRTERRLKYDKFASEMSGKVYGTEIR